MDISRRGTETPDILRLGLNKGPQCNKISYIKRFYLQSITGDTLSRLVPKGLTQKDSLFVAALVPLIAIAQVK